MGRYLLYVNGKKKLRVCKFQDLRDEVSACLSAGDDVFIFDSLRNKTIQQAEVATILNLQCHVNM